MGRRSAARDLYERALRALPHGDAPPTAAALIRWIAGTYHAEADHAAAEDCLESAVACAEASGDVAGVGYGVNLQGILRWQQGDLDGAVRFYADARTRALHAGDARLAAMTAQNLGVIANIRGDFTRALLFYEASLADYRSMGLARDICVALNNLGMVYTDMERWHDAEAAYGEAVELVRDLGDVALRVQIEVNSVEMWVARGDIARARAAAGAAMALADRLGESQVPGDAYKLLGVIARESGELARADELLGRAADVALARQDLLLQAEIAREQAEVHRRLGRNREMLQALNRAHRLFTQLRAGHDLADVDRRTVRLESEFLDVVRRWSESIEAKDRYTRGHCERVADLACALAAHAGLDERTLFWFRIGALLHDVGKLIVPAEVLNKPSKLSHEEWALMKRHPQAGVTLLAGIDFPWDVRPLIESHHERWDGRGYPHGLAGEAIPMTARILCLADVFDALTSQRSYKQSMAQADALEIMRRDVGRAFDPELFPLFERVIAERTGGRGAAASHAHAAGDARSAELPERRACTLAATRLLAVRRRDGGAASLVYARVDRHRILRARRNDRGDDATAQVVAALRAASRGDDVLGRFGPDDFVLLRAGATAESAAELARTIRTALGSEPVGEVAAVALAVAGAPEHGDSLDALVAAARRAAIDRPVRARHVVVAAESAASPARPPIERFVGRLAERRRLAQHLDASLRADPRIVAVIGPSGVGKSSLVSRLALDARLRSARYVVARCRAGTFRQPFGPWIEVIEAVRAAGGAPDRRWAVLPRLVPSLAGSGRLASGGDEAASDGGALRDELCEFLAAAAAVDPLVVILEDVDHADEGSWEVIGRLAEGLEAERVLVCLTMADARVAALRRLGDSPRYRELRLSGLTGSEVRQWLDEVFADERTAEACAGLLLGGVPTVTPLWAAHALHTLVDQRWLVPAARGWLATDALASRPGPPADMQRLVTRRIARLTPKARAILGELALLGDTFEVDLAMEAGIGSEADVLDAIDEAMTASLVREEGHEPGVAFAFGHGVIAAVARRVLDAPRRQRAHERIACALERVRPVAIFEIAAHYDAAGIQERAFEYALLAAARAASLHAWADAAEAYEQARAHAATPWQRDQVEQLAAQLRVSEADARVS